MKFTNQLKILITILASYHVFGQNPNPAAGATAKFDSYPINLSSGMPDVSIPLHSSPTWSKDVSLDFTLRYHPASISKSQKNLGNCGSGWSLSPGGTITRTASQMQGIFYQFNFMGMSGKFIFQHTPSGDPIATLTESNGTKPVIEIIAGSTNQVIAGFVIYDNLGYKYKFMQKDITYEADSSGPTAKDNNFQLTEIYDNNNNLLVAFEYEAFNRQVWFGPELRINKLYFLKKVVISGYGTIELEANYYNSDEIWVAYYSMYVYDIKGNTVKSFSFYNEPEYFQDGKIKMVNLTRVDLLDTAGANAFTYKLFYKPFPIYDPVTPYEGGYDEFGYYTTVDKRCENITVDSQNVASGVLEKMILPTGGCVIYAYEANNYSFSAGYLMDSGDPGFYYRLPEDSYHTNNLHNYTRNYLGNFSLGNNEINFGFAQPTRVYFRFNGAGVPNGLGGMDYPKFYLRYATGTLRYDFDSQFASWGSCRNYGTGMSFDLQGDFKVVTVGGTNPYAEIYTLTPKTELQRWWYGGGIRVKAIAYFTDSTIPQDYFSQSPLAYAKPAKLTNYKYNLFSNPDYSSGSTNSLEDGSGRFVYYTNIAVYEGQGLGRTEYTFFPPATHKGNLINKKMYNEAGELQLESSYDYEWRQGYPLTAGPVGENMGWSLPKEQIDTEVFPSGNVSSRDAFIYDANNKLTEKTTSNSRSTVFKTKYYYTSANSIYSKNRIELDYSEQYLSSLTLLSTAKTEYLNNWTDTAGSNVSYLPSEIKTSKGSGALETKSKVNRYDRYGHVLEAEKPGGIKTSFIWAYNNTQIVAEIVNMSYSAIPQSLITNIQAATDTANPSMDLNTALNNLRNATELADALITTYTYKPLVGVLTKTDARGYKISYEYDSRNMQVRVKDQDGNIISENVYYTKPQN